MTNTSPLRISRSIADPEGQRPSVAEASRLGQFVSPLCASAALRETSATPSSALNGRRRFGVPGTDGAYGCSIAGMSSSRRRIFGEAASARSDSPETGLSSSYRRLDGADRGDSSIVEGQNTDERTSSRASAVGGESAGLAIVLDAARSAVALLSWVAGNEDAGGSAGGGGPQSIRVFLRVSLS